MVNHVCEPLSTKILDKTACQLRKIIVATAEMQFGNSFHVQTIATSRAPSTIYVQMKRLQNLIIDIYDLMLSITRPFLVAGRLSIGDYKRPLLLSNHRYRTTGNFDERIILTNLTNFGNVNI